MEDGSTDDQLQQETLCRRQWTDEYVERPETLMRQNVVVVWLQCLLVDVVRHTGTLYVYNLILEWARQVLSLNCT